MPLPQTSFSLPVRVGLVAVLLVVLSGCTQSQAGFTTPTVSARTADERRESLDALKAAWDSRPAQHSPENERAERLFLNRLISFVHRTRGQEIYGEACQLWNSCYHEHATRYRDYVAESGQS